MKMKRILVTLTVLVLAALAINANIPNTKAFEGKIVYDILYPDQDGGATSSGELVYYLKGDQSRLVQPMGGGMEQVVLSDHAKHDRKILLNFLGKQVCISMNAAEWASMEEGKLIPEIAYTKETKTIAGISCKKAICTFSEGGKRKSLEVYYARKISNEMHGEFPGLKGFPLEYESAISGMPVRLVAKSVSIEAVPAALFDIPEGYESMTMEELQQSMQEGQ
jgi:GLPGLI family protein